METLEVRHCAFSHLKGKIAKHFSVDSEDEKIIKTIIKTVYI